MTQIYQFPLRVLLSGIVAVIAVACTSPPARFYTLGITANEPVTASLAGSRIIVGPISMPAYLDHPQMVIRDQHGELTYQEFQRWAEPIDAAFLRILTEDLSIVAGTPQVIAVPISQRMAPDFRVFARVSRFDVDRDGRAVLDVQWYASDSKGVILVTPRTASYTRSAAVPLEPAAIAAALSGTIAAFAADVASQLGRLRQ